MKPTEIDDLIVELRHEIVIGGGYADVSANDLERLFAEINRLRADDPPILVPDGFDLRPGAINKVYR